MTTKKLKNEVDKLPDNLLEQVYAVLKNLTLQQIASVNDAGWAKWKNSLDSFTTDFMEVREHPLAQIHGTRVF
jgi:uncharacterized protein HemX